MIYRREIDGLRALAVMPVILFHAGFGVFGGGFVGVDVFFVISGYLITRILIEENRTGNRSILGFYERRARRILPALLLVLGVCFGLGFVVMLPSEIKELSASQGSVILFVSNFYFMSQVGYFAAEAGVQPLLHTWSLAVEEQFYLILPLLLWAGQRAPKRWMIAGLIALTALSFGGSEIAWRANAERNFFFSGPRFWELLAGSLCAYALVDRPLGHNGLFATLGLVLILTAIFGLDAGTPFPSAYTLLPVVGTVLILLYADSDTVVGKLLSTRALVGIGLISYSAYLWHQPIFAFARVGSLAEPSGIAMAGLAGLTLALAGLTWAYVEQPFRRRKARLLPARGQLFAVGGALSGLFLGLAILGYQSAGYDRLWRALYPQRVPMLDLIVAAKAPVDWPAKGCVFTTKTFDSHLQGRLRACRGLHGKGVLVIGDSHAIDLFGTIVQSASAPFVLGVVEGGCRPHTPAKGCLYDATRSFVAANPRLFDLILYEQAGFYLLSSPSHPEGSRRMFAELGLRVRVPDFEVNTGRIELVRAYLASLAEFVPVVWFGPRPEPHVPLDVILRTGCADVPLRPGLIAQFLMLEDRIEKDLPSENLHYLSQTRLYSMELPRDFGGCDGLYWRDGDHLSGLGQRAMAARADVVRAARDLVGAVAGAP